MGYIIVYYHISYKGKDKNIDLMGGKSSQPNL